MSAAESATPEAVILVGGEALFDLVLEDGSEDLRAHPGGGPFNTARTLARLRRPGIIADPDGYRARMERVLRRCDVVKVSEEDLAWLEPRRSWRTAAPSLLERGPAVVLLTRGSEGAVVVTARGDVEVPVPPTNV